MIKYTRPFGPPLAAADLRELEGLLGVPLPQDYASFLLESNGAWPEDDIYVCVPTPGWVGGDVAGMKVLHAYHSTIDGWDIWQATWGIQERLPPGCIVIGRDGCSGVYVMRGAGPRVGEVLLRDVQEEDPDDPCSALYPVAKSFTEFLEMMYTEPRSDPSSEADSPDE